VELGLALQTDKHPQECVALARRAEEGGFDVVSVIHDLLFQPAIVPLCLIARETERVRVGPAALNPYTLHPVEIAGQIAALDLVSHGRAYLGLVQGAWLDRIGLARGQSLAALQEAVEVIHRLLAGDHRGFDGQYFSLASGAGLRFQPLRSRLPLMIGTWGKRTATWAATVADEVKIGGCANPEMVALMREWLGPEIGLVAGAVTVVDEDGKAARQRARAEVGMYLEVVRDLDPTLPRGKPAPVDRFTLAGTPEEVAERASELFRAGATRVEFGPPQGLSCESGVRLLCQRVLPLLRESSIEGG